MTYILHHELTTSGLRLGESEGGSSGKADNEQDSKHHFDYDYDAGNVVSVMRLRIVEIAGAIRLRLVQLVQ